VKMFEKGRVQSGL